MVLAFSPWDGHINWSIIGRTPLVTGVDACLGDDYGQFSSKLHLGGSALGPEASVGVCTVYTVILCWGGNIGQTIGVDMIHCDANPAPAICPRISRERV